MLRVINGDVRAAVIAEKLARVQAYGRYKKKFLNLLDNYVEYYEFAGGVFDRTNCIGVSFKSPVHDGWLNEHKPVADLFFPGYAWGGKHWPDDVEDIYPYLALHIRTAEEKAAYAPYLISWDVTVEGPLFIPPWQDSDGWAGQWYSADAYYEKKEVWEDVTTYDYATGQTVVTPTHVRDVYTFFSLGLSYLDNLPNEKFYEFITNSRLRFDVDVAKSSWLEFVLPAIIIIVVIAVTIATAGTAAPAAASASATTTTATGIAAMEGAAIAVELGVYGSLSYEALVVLGGLSYAYSAYSTYSTLDMAMKMSQGGPQSFSITPDEEISKAGRGPVLFGEYEMHPVEATYARFEKSVNLT